MTAPVPRCTQDCAWRKLEDHDQLVTMQEDSAVLAEVLSLMATGAAHDLSRRVGLYETHDFIKAHNWPDPLAARWLADNLEQTFNALQPRSERKAV